MDLNELLKSIEKVAPLHAGFGSWVDKDQNKIENIMNDVRWFFSCIPNCSKIYGPMITPAFAELNEPTQIKLIWWEKTNSGMRDLSNDVMIAFWGDGKVTIKIHRNNKVTMSFTELCSGKMHDKIISLLSKYIYK
jgi:hypothetical protein